jgi:hypothetical protein
LYCDDTFCDASLLCRLQINLSVRGQLVTLRAHLPADYPAHAAPLAVVEGDGVTTGVTDWAFAQLNDLFLPGEAVLYTWAEAVRDHLDATLESTAGEEAHAAAVVAAAAEAATVEQRAEVRPAVAETGR